MKILCVSDIILDAFFRNIENKFPQISIKVIYSENLAAQLFNTGIDKDVELIYIHIDSIFKKYSKNYLVILLNSLYEFALNTTKKVLCSNLIFESFKSNSLSNTFGFIIDNNRSFFEFFIDKQLKNLYFIDVWNVVLNIGATNSYNYRLGHLYQMPYTKSFLSEFEIKLTEYIKRIDTPDKKVIIVDCDNTLWQGILGEDGIDGIKCDLNTDGILFYHFQQFLIQKKDEGYLLVICSKNNEKDVEDVFNKKPMPLQWDDFVLKKINWNNKVENIKEIASELNVSLDSFVFIDDSDFEIKSVDLLLPQIHTIKMNNDYSSFNKINYDLNLLKKTIVTEDLTRTSQYLQESQRKKLKNSSISFDDYIKSLEIKIQLSIDSEIEFERISQLTEKTNQFNFNKKIIGTAELISMVKRGEIKVFSIKVNDKYGDYGLVGVILVTFLDGFPVLENFILSCRALGRKIEYEFLKMVEDKLILNYGSKFKFIKFEKTEKNIPAVTFYNEIKQNYGI